MDFTWFIGLISILPIDPVDQLIFLIDNK